MSQAVFNVNNLNAKIHYHTGVFNWKKNAAIAVVGFVGLTTLVLGILLLHTIQGLPPAAMYAMSAAGGGILLLDAIVCGVFIVRVFKIRNQMQESMAHPGFHSHNDEAQDLVLQTPNPEKFWKDIYNQLKKDTLAYITFTFQSTNNIPGCDYHVIRQGEDWSIHVFHDENKDGN